MTGPPRNPQCFVFWVSFQHFINKTKQNKTKTTTTTKKNILSTQGVILLIRITAEKHILRISVMSVLGWLCLCLSPSPRCPWISEWCILGLVPWKNWRGSTPTRPVGRGDHSYFPFIPCASFSPRWIWQPLFVSLAKPHGSLRTDCDSSVSLPFST